MSASSQQKHERRELRRQQRARSKKNRVAAAMVRARLHCVPVAAVKAKRGKVVVIELEPPYRALRTVCGRTVEETERRLRAQFAGKTPGEVYALTTAGLF